jgi:hypothetical protein
VKSEGEVRQKLKQVLFRHQKSLLKANFKKRPETCAHNALVELDKDSDIGLCMFQYPKAVEPRGLPCDERIGGVEQARKCELWEPIQSKDEIKAEFQVLFEDTAELAPIAAEYPDAAALLWVLGNGEMDEKTTAEEDLPDDPVTKGWDWGRWPWSRGGKKP